MITVAIDQFKKDISQLGVWNGSKMIVGYVCQKLTNRYNKFSYSQTGEDAIIRGLLFSYKYSGNCQYVDVGCNHPSRDSNTFDLYRSGWNGVTIDGNQALIDLHRKTRPKDKSVCAVVSSEIRDMTFTEYSDSLVSSVDSEHALSLGYQSDIVSQKTVRTRTLTEILDSVQFSHTFGVLSIDVEGHDYEVLTSLDFSKYRPFLIVIEIHNFAFLEPYDNPIYLFLVSKGYIMVGYATMNAYFKFQDKENMVNSNAEKF
jgi:FkbM family methyltransferase